MALRNDFKEQAAEISGQLRALTGQRGAWTDDLEAALSCQKFNDAQMGAIRAAATQTCLSDMGDGAGGVVDTSLAQKLTHAFKDPVQNSAMLLQFCAEGVCAKDEQEALILVTQARGALRDIVYNYPLMLREDMPGNVRGILDTYEGDVLPKLDRMISEIAALSGFDPDTIPAGEDWQHLHRLDPEPFG